MRFRLALVTGVALLLVAVYFVRSSIINKHNPLPSETFLTYEVPKITDRSPAAQAKAAHDFLGLLNEKLKKKTLFNLDSEERRKWTNYPPKRNEMGARLGELNVEQIQAAMRLLATVLSEAGYYKARSIPLGDDQTVPEGKRYHGFGTQDYRVVIFGNPSESESWALQFDGHHLAINVSIHGEKMSLSPSLFGTQPHYFKLGEREFRPIEPFTDKAHAVVNTLQPEQQSQAILSDESKDTRLAYPENDGEIPELVGIKGSELNQEQKDLMISLISEYVNCLPDHASQPRIQSLSKEVDQMYFSWNGATAKKSPMSYRIQGPSIIIEYACQLFSPDPLDQIDHIHTVYRDPSNEYGQKFMK
ncbi:MAG: DUF3500 domain-containing protein [Verrucomicrobiota bacterium]